MVTPESESSQMSYSTGIVDLNFAFRINIDSMIFLQISPKSYSQM